MFTPWRPVTFVHAVRTPLKDPKLFLLPTKSAIGQTYAVFDGRGRFTRGTVLMSRKSTARIDVDATWQMPVDTGTNTDPVTPQDFAGHAFTLEIAAPVAGGVDPDARHVVGSQGPRRRELPRPSTSSTTRSSARSTTRRRRPASTSSTSASTSSLR